MYLTAQLKLLPTAIQAESLERTLLACNAACDYISAAAWKTKTFRQFDLHRLCYRAVREHFDLGAQAVVSAISKVADAYKGAARSLRTFRKAGSIAYDRRMLSYNCTASTVSIWSLTGRLRIPFVCGPRQTALLASETGETDLAFVRGHWYLNVSCKIPDATPAIGPFMGVDLGIRNTAATSHGALHSGTERQQFKQERDRVRASLQARNKRRARKALRRQAGRERRRITWENHNISKAIVAEAEGTQCGGIRMERLTGIRQRCKVRNKHVNRMVSGWSFGQLQRFIAYKAERCGIRIEYVEAAYTSQTCAVCGALGSRCGDVFSCRTCGEKHSDVNAAVNIAADGVALGAKQRARKPARIAAKRRIVSHVKSRLPC